MDVNINDNSDKICFFCDERKLEHTYQCCKKQCCNICYNTFYDLNKFCPWCRQDPSICILPVSNNSYNNILIYFENWLLEHNIKNSYNTIKCLNHIKIINQCFQNKNDFKIQFQVANLNKIHVFKYSDYKEISFKYHEQWDLIEVKGGEYLFYDELRESDHFGWWLHGFVKQL